MKTVSVVSCLWVLLLSCQCLLTEATDTTDTTGTTEATGTTEDTGTTEEASTSLSFWSTEESDPADPPIALSKYSHARFLAGTSTNTRFVTTTVSTTATCLSDIDDAAAACPTGKRRRRRFIKAIYASKRPSPIDSSLLQDDFNPSDLELPSGEGRLLFSAATSFTTLTFTQNVDGPNTVSVSVSCAPPGVVTLCFAP